MRIDRPGQPSAADQLLDEVFSRRLMLTEGGALWAPNTHVPQEVRQGIRAHRRVLVSKIEEGDIRVCPSHDLHRQSWTWENGTWICGYCKKLLKAVC